MTEEALFQDALSRSPEQRAAFLDQACAGQPELRAAVEALLTAHDKSGNILDESAGTLGQTVDSDPGAGRGAATVALTVESEYGFAPRTAALDYSTKIEAGIVLGGRYTLQKKIGEGGMGEVWSAQQTEPVKRVVALKLIKTGMDSKAVLSRFDHERQALALMDHPNIARVLDGGMTPTGQPFFVMDLVNGLALNKFCDDAKLTPRERLELFVPICQAVQHAHQKGIVHRDLKPANILVTTIDGRHVPKVIDFGVAKAIAGKITEESLSTQFGAIVGTLEYMSPEQAGYSGEDIDTRADIYSLGVILYELLTGLRPLDSRRLNRAALTEMIRVIREEEPSKPSTRLSTEESLPLLAASRHMEPGRLLAMLRGELDWVVMKCLEKQRDRRYETASGLARDIQRYLADEPVEARPHSAGYRLAKFVRRNKGPVAAAMLILLALVGGIVGTTLGLLEAKRQEKLAIDAKLAETERAEAEIRQRQRAEKAEAETRQRANELEQVAQFQAKLFEDVDVPLTGVRLRTDLLKNVRATAVKSRLEPAAIEARIAEVERDVAGLDFAGMALQTLEQNVFLPALQTIEKQFSDQPLVRASLQQTIASTCRELGLLELAMKPQVAALKTRREKLGNHHPDTLISIRTMSSLLRMRGQLAEAEPLLQEALDGCRKEFGEDDLRTIECVNLFGTLRHAQGLWAEEAKFHAQALPGFRRIKGEDHENTLEVVSALGSALTNMGKFDEAEKMLLEAVQKLTRRYGVDSRQTIFAENNLGAVYLGMSRYEEAEHYYRLSLDGMHRSFGDLHPHTISSMDNMGSLLSRQNRLEEALGFINQALEKRRLLFGDDSLITLRSVHNLATVYRKQLKFAEAEANFRKALEGYRRMQGPNRPDTMIIATNLGLVLKDRRKFSECEKIFREVLEGRRTVLGPAQRDTIAATVNLADLLDMMQRQDESLRLVVESEKAARGAYTGSQLKLLGDFLSRLGGGYLRAGQFQLGDAALTEAYKLLLDGYGPTGDSTILCADRQIDLYTRWNSAEGGKGYDVKAGELIDKAIKVTNEQLSDARKKTPRDSLPLASALAKAGARLLKIKRFVEAEPILQEVLTIQTKLKPDAWETYSTQALLGDVWLVRKDYENAQRMLLAGYHGMKKHENEIPPASRPLFADSIDRLVRLYEVTGKPDEAAKWRKELDAANKLPEETNGK